jgi:NADH dehydrogenase
VREGQQVVVVGAGFGGLFAARRLARSDVRVTLIDRRNFHTFTPLLYQVAAAEIEAEEITYPVRTIFRGQKNLRLILGEVTRVNLDACTLDAAGVTIKYDSLILALGSSTHFFGAQVRRRTRCRSRIPRMQFACAATSWYASSARRSARTRRSKRGC